jgi:hypothetical protein
LKNRREDIPPLMHQGNIFYTAKQKANLLASCFEENQKITTPLVRTSFDYAVDRLVDKYRKRRSPTSDGIPRFHTSTVQRLIRRLRPRTAPGMDGVTNRLLRHLPPLATKYLTALHNKLNSDGVFPICMEIGTGCGRPQTTKTSVGTSLL